MNPSENIDNQIAGLGDWRGAMYSRLRQLVNQADPRLAEDWKWDTAVWKAKGNVCAVSAFKTHVKINFLKGASVADPAGLFNAGLEAKTSRSIDFHEGDAVNEPALQDLVRAAVDLDQAKKK